jgi:hypothetical protein
VDEISNPEFKREIRGIDNIERESTRAKYRHIFKSKANKNYFKNLKSKFFFAIHIYLFNR